MILFTISFAANTLITFTVAITIWFDRIGVESEFGPDTPARRILACLYLAIGLISIYGLALISLGRSDDAISIVTTLFPLQILYKIMTAIAVGLHSNVVRANLGVVALLSLTLIVSH
jgi:hypothetical protein